MLGDHKNAVLQFSGGKDSTALLYSAREYLDRITVVYCDTGAAFPHVRDFVFETCDRLNAKLHVARPAVDVVTYTSTVGFPSDLVPVDDSPEMSPYIKQTQKIQSYVNCCAEMIWRPLHATTKNIGATLVLRGVKKCDSRRGVPPGFVHDGVRYDAPLWERSDAWVMEYLRGQGVELPVHYKSTNDSLDCWLCSAHLAHGGAGRLEFTRTNYPGLWPEVSRRVRAVRGAIDKCSASIAEPFAIADRDAR